MTKPAELRLGTSAFTAAGWEGSFYPEGMPAREFLSYYSQKFDTVEVDSTFYRSPSHSTVRGWYEKTPKDFIFSAKVPQIITHEKCLVDCGEDLATYLGAMDLLGEKLGPLLFQFGYFNKKAFKTVDEFLARLIPFLAKLPKGYKFALEIRNKYWLVPKFIDVLRKHGVALAMVDQSWMLANPADWFAKFDPITADFTYIRWLGDRKGIEEQTKTWDKVIVDRSKLLSEWSKVCYTTTRRGVPTFAYANNHYAGNAPLTIEMFRKIWEKQIGREK